MTGRSFENRRILLTGATGSIGREVAFHLARHGAELILPGRNQKSGESLKADLLARCPGARITLLPVDMGDESSVLRLADLLLEENKPLDALIHNAGVLTRDSQLSPQGIEWHRQVNALSPLLLTKKLLPLLNAAPQPVVLSVTSLSAFYVSDDPKPGLSSPTLLYAHSKRSLLLEMEKLAKSQPDIAFLYAHPGICATGLFTDETNRAAYNRYLMKIALPVMRRVFMPPERACQPILYGLFHGQPGQLAEPRGLLNIWGKPRLMPLTRRLKTHR